MKPASTYAAAGIGIENTYKLMASMIAPRPIGFVTTIDGEGRVNAAPFSFFNGVSFEPPLIVLGLERHSDRPYKDTAANIAENGEFVCNLVSHALAEPMNRSAVNYDHGVDELAEVGLTPGESVDVKPPRILEAPGALECRRYVTLELGPRRQIVVGEVVRFWIADEAHDPTRFHVFPEKLDLVGRMGGAAYATTRDRFDMPRVDVTDWRSKPSGEG